jgi:hypothetical protein
VRTTTSILFQSPIRLYTENNNLELQTSNMMNGLPDQYWKLSFNELQNSNNIIVIHVNDETRQVTKDFCCCRNILVQNMKYFETFLIENENGYDDIDISVHCDVDIFEWLMTYIHNLDSYPPIEQSMVVSILISSDFLQMDSLVEICTNFIAKNLGDILKLPIDLSCISEKLVNKIALATSPKVISEKLSYYSLSNPSSYSQTQEIAKINCLINFIKDVWN